MLEAFYGWNGMQNFINWFSSLSSIQQIIISCVGFALAVAIIVLVFIGLAYLLKYIFMGLAYLLKYIFMGLFYILEKLFKGLHIIFRKLYEILTGKSSSEKSVEPIYNEKIEENRYLKKSIIILPKKTGKSSEHEQGLEYSYCPECGIRFTEKMNDRLNLNGKTYCVNCGQSFIIEQQIINPPIAKSFANYK